MKLNNRHVVLIAAFVFSSSAFSGKPNSARLPHGFFSAVASVFGAFQRAPSDSVNNCAFDVLGLERRTAIQALIDRLSDPILRRMVAVDYANWHQQTELTDDMEALTDYLRRHFLNGVAMPGYYPGPTNEQQGGILVALAAMDRTQLRVFIGNADTPILVYQPSERIARILRVNHVAADPEYPNQLNHYELRRRLFSELPFDLLVEMTRFISPYPDGRNMMLVNRQINQAFYQHGYITTPGLRRVPKGFFLRPFDALANPESIRRLSGCLRATSWIQELINAIFDSESHGQLATRAFGRLQALLQLSGARDLNEALPGPDSVLLTRLTDRGFQEGDARKMLRWCRPLDFALILDAEEAARILIEAGANPDLLNACGCAPLDILMLNYAQDGFHLPTGEDPDSFGFLLGLTSARMNAVAEAILRGDLEFIRRQPLTLLLMPPGPDEPTPVALAAGHSSVEVVRYLLDKIETEGPTSVLLRELVGFFQEELPNYSMWTDVTAASYFGRIDVLSSLGELRSFDDQFDAQGYGIVTAAAAGRQLETLRFIHDQLPINIFAADESGRTAYSIAQENSFTEILEYLEGLAIELGIQL